MGMIEQIIMISIIVVLTAILVALSVYKKRRGEKEEFLKTSANKSTKEVGNDKKEASKKEEKKGEQITLNKGFKYVVSEKNKIKPGKYIIETKNSTGLTNNDSIVEINHGEKIELKEGDKISSKDHKMVIQQVN